MVFLAALVTSNGWMNGMLSAKPLVFIGRLSYGMYLIHILCLNVVEKYLGPGRGLALPAFVATCALTILVAWVLHVTVEEPLIAVGKNYLKRRRAPALIQALPGGREVKLLPEDSSAVHGPRPKLEKVGSQDAIDFR